MAKNRLYVFVLAACVAGYVWLFANILLHQQNMAVGCLFYKVTHVPCPSCGSTRSVLSLMKGNITDAFYYNPIGFMLVAIMIVLPVWILIDLIAKKDSFIWFYNKMEFYLKKKYIFIPLILLVLINWIWNFYKYL